MTDPVYVLGGTQTDFADGAQTVATLNIGGSCTTVVSLIVGKE
jgi:hypothetical protein